MYEIITAIDIKVLDFIQSSMRCLFLDTILPIITSLGDKGMIWIILSIILILQKKYRTQGVMLITALILCGTIGNLFLKPTIARVRPYDSIPDIILLINKPTDYSFPSGHTMAAFASFSVFLLVSDKRWLKICIGILAFSIAFSRLYLYVHYPSDVLAGILFGSIFGIVSVKVWKKMKVERN